jgi:hypothetical protein
MGTELYNKIPGYIKEMDNYKAFKKVEIISFYGVEEFVSL